MFVLGVRCLSTCLMPCNPRSSLALGSIPGQENCVSNEKPFSVDVPDKQDSQHLGFLRQVRQPWHTILGITYATIPCGLREHGVKATMQSLAFFTSHKTIHKTALDTTFRTPVDGFNPNMSFPNHEVFSTSYDELITVAFDEDHGIYR